MRKAMILIALLIVTVVSIPIAFSLVQSGAIQGLRFSFISTSITDVELPPESSLAPSSLATNIKSESLIGSLGEVVASLSPILTALDISNKVFTFLTETEVVLAFEIRAENPSFIEVEIDRYDVAVTLNEYYVGAVQIESHDTVPPGGNTTITLSGLTINLADLIEVVSTTVSNDYRLDMHFNITTHLPALFGDMQLDGNLGASLYLIPPKPSLVDVAIDSFNGHFEATLINNYKIPVDGELFVGLLKNPFWPVDNGFINYLRMKLQEPLDMPVWSKQLTLDPDAGASLSIDYTDLRAFTRYVFIILWKPSFGVAPYVYTFKMSEQVSGSGLMDSQQLQTTQKIIYYLARDFGYMGNKEFTTVAQVTDVWWEDPSGTKITKANNGDSVSVGVKTSTNIQGELTFSIRKDVVVWLDKTWLDQSFTISSLSETFRVGFDIDEAEQYGGFPRQVRGYFIEVLFDGSTIYTMENSYPPRLEVGEPSAGTPSVFEAYWVVEGERVTSVDMGSQIEAHITIIAQGGQLSGELLVKVKKDIALWPDTDYDQSSFAVNLAEGELEDFYFMWFPDEPGMGSLRGYFIEVWFNNEKIYTMESSYPPRLEVET